VNRSFLILAAVCFWAPALADEGATRGGGKAPLMVSFTDLKWTELPERKGMQFAVLSGDPRKGEYTQMRKVPAGTDNPLHTHGSELKNVIIRGVWYTGVDTASARDFGPGSIVMMPANWVAAVPEAIACSIRRARASSTSDPLRSRLAADRGMVCTRSSSGT
jgi:hypothetical protein